MNKKDKSTAINVKVLLLAIGLIGLAQGATEAGSFTIEARPHRILEAIQAPPTLGGVALERPKAFPALEANQIAVKGTAVENNEAAPSPSRADTVLDRMRTASITPGVFGSIALPMRNFPVAARWAPVYQAIVECSASLGCGQRTLAFSNLMEIAARKDLKEKLSFVNSSINRMIAYKKDDAVYGTLDHWAKPSETLDLRAGDCEDFAILKMTALLGSGVPAQSMSLVILQDRRRGFFHAVLSVSTPDGAYILDNLSNLVRKDNELPDYQPLYSFSADRAWIHGTKVGGPILAEVKGGLTAVAPGEGI